ncbi:hypothetical protein E4U52_001418, partial [Claviceps spartinae]
MNPQNDLLPSTPPLGVATFQGDFLSPRVRKLVKEFIARTKVHDEEYPQKDEAVDGSPVSAEPAPDQRSYIDQERHASEEVKGASDDNAATAS